MTRAENTDKYRIDFESTHCVQEFWSQNKSGSMAESVSRSGEERLAARKPYPPPPPGYLPTAGSPLVVDRALYLSIQKAPRVLVQSFVLPIRSGRAWKAPAGSIVRISTPEGAQVGSRHPPCLTYRP